jgi:tRNA pseudouridine55 synthase
VTAPVEVLPNPLRRTGRPPGVTGVLNLAKPAGITSFAAIRDARRALGERHIGHAGTLDPAATGVLPLCVGRATRLVEYILREPKTYRARLRLGETSDTGDLEGDVRPGSSAAALDRNQLEKALEGFVGRIEQVPPMHSAVRHQGRHLYELARQGVTVERKPRLAEIHSIQLLSFTPGEVAEAEVEVVCGKGTYLRVLATDLGERLAVGGVLGWLERTAYGPFHLEQAVSVSQLLEADDPRSLLLPPEAAVERMPRVDLLPGAAAAVQRGQGAWLQRGLQGEQAGGEVRAHGPDGRLLAVGTLAGLRFQPLKVIAPIGG